MKIYVRVLLREVNWIEIKSSMNWMNGPLDYIIEVPLPMFYPIILMHKIGLTVELRIKLYEKLMCSLHHA